eukprot:985117-Prymnesium_polylepis.1
MRHGVAVLGSQKKLELFIQHTTVNRRESGEARGFTYSCHGAGLDFSRLGDFAPTCLPQLPAECRDISCTIRDVVQP